MAAQTEYQQGLDAIKRRRAIADAMQAQAMSPLSAPLSGTGNYPIQTRISPLQVLAQLGTAYVAKKQNERADKDYSELAKAMASDRSKALAALQVPQDMTPSYQVDPNADDSQGPTRMIQQPTASNSGPNLTAAQNALDSGIDPQVVAASLKTQRSENEPNSVREYQFAKENGYKGTFDQWIKMGGQTSRPSSVQEWEFFSALSPDDQNRYLVMKRAQKSSVEDLAGGKSVVTVAPQGGVTTTSLTTAQAEREAAERLKNAENRGGAVGTAEGGVTGGIIKKGSDAENTTALLDAAEPLIDVATGSPIGAGADKLSALFGGAPDGAKAIASLKVLQAGLMTSMPRMEGPQSDADVKLYREAAGQIGDPSVPRDIKKAALVTIRDIQQRYKARARSVLNAPSATATAGIETAAQRAKRMGL